MTDHRIKPTTNMQSYFLPSIIGLSIVSLAAIGLGIFSTLDLARGPGLAEIRPSENNLITKPLITVTGRAERIDRLYFNDRQIFANPDGLFAETLLLLPGYNILTLRAEDRFDRQVIKRLNLVYRPD